MKSRGLEPVSFEQFLHRAGARKEEQGASVMGTWLRLKKNPLEIGDMVEIGDKVGTHRTKDVRVVRSIDANCKVWIAGGKGPYSPANLKILATKTVNQEPADGTGADSSPAK